MGNPNGRPVTTFCRAEKRDIPGHRFSLCRDCLREYHREYRANGGKPIIARRKAKTRRIENVKALRRWAQRIYDDPAMLNDLELLELVDATNSIVNAVLWARRIRGA